MRVVYMPTKYVDKLELRLNRHSFFQDLNEYESEDNNKSAYILQQDNSQKHITFLHALDRMICSWYNCVGRMAH